MKGVVIFLANSIFWVSVHFLSGFISHIIKPEFYSIENFIFKPRRWELNGKIYTRIFLVRLWKDKVPEAGELFKINPFNKKRLVSKDEKYLERFLLETCRAEFSHLLPILFFPLCVFFNPPVGIWINLAYVLLANLPFIIIQRYNRIRFNRILKRTKNQ
jgi:glycosyl-4,4'-diaponeurosporenoate acyltransferase